jgi:hypothetical protein
MAKKKPIRVKVRLCQTAAGPNGVVQAGGVIEVGADQAEDLIQSGQATPVRGQPVETATAEPPAETTSKRKGTQRAPRKVDPPTSDDEEPPSEATEGEEPPDEEVEPSEE